MSKLFILEDHHGGQWVPITFIAVPYRKALVWFGTNRGPNSRLRRVQTQKECSTLELRMCKETIPVGSAYTKKQWKKLDLFDQKYIEWTP